MTDQPDDGRPKYGRVDVDRPVTVVFAEARELQRRDLRMANVGLGGCLLLAALPPGERVAVLVHRSLFIVGRVMPGADASGSRVEWSPDAGDADELVAVFGLPEA